MFDNVKLLVVDDEAVICQACRRIFARQGFQVEASTDAREGLGWATQRDYAGILLDIRMPEMDGIQFLEELREIKPDVPVMIMTGYPSIPNAASAIRLGASDYITKPFTPEQITQSVRRMLTHRSTNGNDRSTAASPIEESWVPRTEHLFFLDESWLQLEIDGSACVGAVLPRLRGASVQAVRLPQIGDVVYQGLPLAEATFADQSQRIVPSPVSGVVIAVNGQLANDPSTLLNDPCGEGWIACICTTRIEEEMEGCKPRRLILVNADEATARRQREQLVSLGCQVEVVKNWEELGPVMRDPDCDALAFDAASLGDLGPELVRRVKVAAPSLKAVVVGSSVCRWETAYREQKIFYYAVEPFSDNEIVEILDAVFLPQGRSLPPAEQPKAPSEPISGVRVTNRNGHKVHLLAAPGLLWRNHGLGWQVMQKLTKRAFPITTTPGHVAITPTYVLRAAGTCDRVMVLLAKDTGRLPGDLLRDTKAEYVSASKENASRVTTLVVQPAKGEEGFAGLDDRTRAALADHIVHEMESY